MSPLRAILCGTIAVLVACALWFILKSWPALTTPDLAGSGGTLVRQTAWPITPPDIEISEFMAANKLGLAHAEAYPDWIELHNPGTEVVSLEGWYLTDDPNRLDKWRFPAVTLGPDGYLLLFAVGEDLTGSDSERHTNFKLSTQGGYLALVKPNASDLSWEYVSYPAQLADVSYGIDSPPRERYFLEPTPGERNGTGVADMGPPITAVSHTEQPPADMPMTITARIETNGNPVANAEVNWQVMYGETITTPLVDDGEHGDGKVSDGVYGATIPADASEPGEMIRYTITATDDEGHVSRWPLFPDPLNSPEYEGTMVADPDLISQLPILNWFVEDADAAKTAEGTRCSLYYDGRFYDNVFVRMRGASATNWPKKQFKFDFNTGDYFYFAPHESPVEEFNLNSTYTDKAYIRRVLAWETYRDAGTLYSYSFPLRLQRNGEPYQVAIFVEQPDERNLKRQGMDPDGALYKLFHSLSSSTESLRKVTRLNEDNSDLQELIDSLSSTRMVRTAYLLDNINIPAVINYLAATAIMHDTDGVAKNYYLYRDTEGTGEWTFIPWDKDLTFGRNSVRDETIFNDIIWADHDPVSHPLFGDYDHPNDDGWWNTLITALYDLPVVREMYLRRLRTVMDELLQPPATPPDELHFENRIDELYEQMREDVKLDAERWAEWEWGEHQTFEEALDILKQDFLAKRRVHLYETHGPPNQGIIPAAQADDVEIEFGPVEPLPESSNPAEAYFSLENHKDVAVDISGWRVSGDVEHEFQPGVVIPAGWTLYVSPDVRAFRARSVSPTGGEGHFVQGNYQEQLGSKGILRLRNSEGGIVSSKSYGYYQTESGPIIISEINYHPLDDESIEGNQFEFMEFKNVGSEPVDMSGFRLVDGIRYTFPQKAILEPGQYLLLARNATVFAQRYPDVTITGMYGGHLGNGGDVITLVDASGRLITGFSYDDTYPWPVLADGDCYTLVRKDPLGDPNDPMNWLSSTFCGGSPGGPDPALHW